MHLHIHICASTHTCMRVYMHPCIHTFAHAPSARIHTHVHSCTPTHTPAHTHVHVPPCTHVHTRVYVYPCTHTCVCMHIHTCKYAHPYMYPSAHTCAHTHMCNHPYMCLHTHACAHMHARVPMRSHKCMCASPCAHTNMHTRRHTDPCTHMCTYKHMYPTLCTYVSHSLYLCTLTPACAHTHTHSHASWHCTAPTALSCTHTHACTTALHHYTCASSCFHTYSHRHTRCGSTHAQSTPPREHGAPHSLVGGRGQAVRPRPGSAAGETANTTTFPSCPCLCALMPRPQGLLLQLVLVSDPRWRGTELPEFAGSLWGGARCDLWGTPCLLHPQLPPPVSHQPLLPGSAHGCSAPPPSRTPQPWRPQAPPPFHQCCLGGAGP